MAEHVDVKKALDKISVAGQNCLNDEPGSRAQLLSALATAQREIEGKGMFLTRMRFSPLYNFCSLIAIESEILSEIVGAKGQSITAGEIAAKTKLDEQLIVRVMRLLTVNGVCDEAGPATYQSNVFAEHLDTPGQRGATRNMTQLMFPIAGKVVEQLRKPEGLSQFPDSDQDITPWRATYGNKSMFEFYETHPEHKEAFDAFMAGRTTGVRRRWFEPYPVTDRLVAGAEENPDAAFMVDIGGGNGQELALFKRAFPEIGGRLILQDLPSTLRTVLPDVPESIERMPHDFFTEQLVKGARAYYLRSVLHDWSDAKCKQILTNTAKAMKPGYSKVIIEEMVLKDVGEGMRGASLDIIMFLMPESIERTLSQWQTLLDSAGLKMVEHWPSSEGTESVIEAVLA